MVRGVYTAVLCTFVILWISRYFFFQAVDGIRDAHESRGLGDVYKRQIRSSFQLLPYPIPIAFRKAGMQFFAVIHVGPFQACLLYTSDAADDLLCVDLGGRRIIKKKTKVNHFVK